jgi:tetratricopeptide (TPR) repeat protein
MTNLRRSLVTLFLLMCCAAVAIAQVRVWQGTLTLPSYEESLPDPNPPFDQLAADRFNYPYTLRTHLTDRRADHNWRALYLENEYLKCSILPDLGGHIYTCIDKVNGKPMFYANPSIKKANIGYRGAWAAFGVEFNFPVSHNWVSLSPVDFGFAQHPDGSASVTVGNIDRVYGMEWSVELVLRPQSTVLEQRVSLSNRSDVRHRFYWWNNAGVEVWDDSHIEYPMRFAASHGFTEVTPWPVDEHGHDLSIIRNQVDGPVSLFVHGSREPFMGVWNPHTNSGTVHFARFDELPAKKAWSWGADADGLDWRKALSDNNSAYVEVQAGLFRNQETYAFLEPQQTIHFSEFWMPVRDIGGITRANLSGVLSLRRDANKLMVGFNANQAVSNASVVISDGHSSVFNTQVDLIPERTWSRQVQVPDRSRKYTVEIRDHSGAVLIRETEDQYEWTPASEISVGPQRGYRVPDDSSRTEDDWLQLGKDQELNGKLLLALDTYKELVRRFPNSYAGLKAEGRLAATLLHYQTAVECLEQVHSRNTTDGEASYYLGIAYEGIGVGVKARPALENAYRMPEWRLAAGLQLAELSAREKEFGQAERYLEEALRISPDELRAAEELVAVQHAAGKNEEAKSFARERVAHFPQSEFLRNELGQISAQEFANDDSRLLRVAAEYMRLGLYQSALDLLTRAYPNPSPDESEPGAPAVARDPMIAYFRAYCGEKLGQSASTDYGTAGTLPTAYIFPSGEQELMVLRRAVDANPQDANAHYLLGTLYFSRGITDEAIALWRRAHELRPSIAVLDASLGRALLYTKDDAEQGLASFREGIRNDRQNPAVYLGTDQSLSILQRPASERVQALQSYPDLASIPSELVFELALALAESADFDRATALFRNRFFPREEGGTNVRQVWIEVQLQHALALAKGGTCNEALTIADGLGSAVPGVSFTKDGLQPFLKSSRTNYLLGKMDSQCGRPEESRKHFEAAAAQEHGGEMVWGWLAAKQLPGFDQKQWTSRLESALQQANSMAHSSGFSGSSLYSMGMLNRTLGHEKEAELAFKRVFLEPDRQLSYHLAREALSKP